MSATRTGAPGRAPARPSDARPARPPRQPGRPGARPPVDPRIRERRAAITRRQGRRRLRVAFLALLAVLCVIAAWCLLHSSLFAARAVDVVGSVHTPRAEILSVAGLSHDPPMIDVDPGAAAARLEKLPWISTATVVRHWPDGVDVTVVERKPVAVVSAPATAPQASSSTTTPATTTTPAATTTPATTTTPARQWALVDRSGRVLGDVSVAPAGLVDLVVPAPAGAPGAPGTDLGAAAAPGLKVAASLPGAFSAQVTGVDVDTNGQVSLQMTTPVTIQLGNVTQLTEKYEAAASVLAGADLVAGDVIDVSVPGSPTVGEG